MVKLARHDLFSPYKPSHYDIVLCRNVIIYFSKEMQARLYMDFYKALNIDGYLVLGKTESMLGDAKAMFSLVDLHERVFQKRKSP
jgi:chemotaxis protein methyltransferase CheR